MNSSFVIEKSAIKPPKGASGIDKMSVDELLPYLKEHQLQLLEQIRDGQYKPNLVRRVEIPKEEKGKTEKEISNKGCIEST